MVDLAEFMKILLTSLVAIFPSIILLHKQKIDANKTISESKQIDSDIKNDKERLGLESRKAEVDVAEKLIKSAGDLIENYRAMIDTFSSKFTAQEERLNSLSVELHAEVKKREKLERTLKDLIVGVKRLLAQLEEHKIVPVWKPKIDIDVLED